MVLLLCFVRFCLLVLSYVMLPVHSKIQQRSFRAIKGDSRSFTVVLTIENLGWKKKKKHHTPILAFIKVITEATAAD